MIRCWLQSGGGYTKTGYAEKRIASSGENRIQSAVGILGKQVNLNSLRLALCIVVLMTTACSGKTDNKVETNTSNSETLPDETKQEETTADKKQEAITLYMEFLKSDEVYRHTSTREYPRGDSQSVYTFVDNDGDGIPELHIDSARWYNIYTCIDGKVTDVRTYDHFIYPFILPLADGALMIGHREAWDRKRFDYSAIEKPEYVGNIFNPEMGYAGAVDLYRYVKLDSTGDEIECQTFAYEYYVNLNIKKYEINGNECTAAEWNEQFEVYKDMLNDTSLHMKWKRVFPEEERYYLDAMELNVPIENICDGRPEWRMYEEILSGEFSSINGFDVRSSLVTQYRDSLDIESGRSNWSYLLLDCNGDDIKELFIQYRSALWRNDYFSTIYACFSYKDENMLCWDWRINNTSYIPLNDGRVISLTYGDVSVDIKIGRLDSDFHFTSEKKYEVLKVWYDDSHDKELYDAFCFEKDSLKLYEFHDGRREFPESMENETDYYFVEDNNSKVMTELSGDEWKVVENEIENLLIPENEWKQASVFMPNRYPKLYVPG